MDGELGHAGEGRAVVAEGDVQLAAAYAGIGVGDQQAIALRMFALSSLTSRVTSCRVLVRGIKW